MLRAGESDVNPLAADSKLRKELLSVGPFCFDADDKVLYCSPNASRTQRSGVTDVDYMKRPDREYCEFKFARSRLTPEVGEDAEMCRANLTARVQKCLLNCDACGAECTSSVVRSLVSAYRCSLGMPTIGLAASFHSSDVGFTIGTRWGAIRERRRPAAPEDAFQEQYRMLIQNRVDKPMAPRNSISCRKPHRESTTGHFVAPLNEKGETVERQGFHVECVTDLDCFSRCGSHPVTGMHYVCTHKLELYSHAGYSKKAYRSLVADGEALRAKGEAHVQVWLPEAHDENFYLMEEAGMFFCAPQTRPNPNPACAYAYAYAYAPIFSGDDKFDIERGSGVCTDTHIDYMHTGCMDGAGALSTMSLTGCSGKAFGWANFFCGSEVDFDEDFVSNVGISARTLLYPRVLVEESMINGKAQLRQTCWNPLDCMDKCDYMERHARDNGLPAPTACALCDPPCPSNIGETLVSMVTALRDDIVSAIRLAVICLNPVACVCQAHHTPNPVSSSAPR